MCFQCVRWNLRLYERTDLLLDQIDSLNISLNQRISQWPGLLGFTTIQHNHFKKRTFRMLRSIVGMTHDLKWTCDGLCGLWVFEGFGWNIKVVLIVNLGLCQTHCKQVPDFPRPSGSDLITWASSFPPVPAFGSICVVLWLLFFRSAPSTFPQRTGYLLGAFSGSP